MKRLLQTHSAVVLAAASLWTSAQAQDINLRLVDFSGWTLLGSAAYSNADLGGGVVNHLLQLTQPGVGSSAGAAFAPAPLLLDLNREFAFDFQFFMAPGTVAQGDGMTFVLTSADPSGFGALGGDGSNLGYGGSGGMSYAFAIDTFHFDGEPVSPSIQILRDGSVDPIAYQETGIGDIRDANFFQWTARLVYTPSGLDDEAGQLTGSIEQFVGNLSFAVDVPVDWGLFGDPVYDDFSGEYLGRFVFYGFTAGNGAADDGHFVSSTTVSPIPLPAGIYLFAPALLGLACRRRVPRH